MLWCWRCCFIARKGVLNENGILWVKNIDGASNFSSVVFKYTTFNYGVILLIYPYCCTSWSIQIIKCRITYHNFWSASFNRYPSWFKWWLCALVCIMILISYMVWSSKVAIRHNSQRVLNLKSISKFTSLRFRIITMELNIGIGDWKLLGANHIAYIHTIGVDEGGPFDVKLCWCHYVYAIFASSDVLDYGVVGDLDLRFGNGSHETT